MVKKIVLKKTPPRDISEQKKALHLHNELFPYYFFGVFFIVAPVFVAVLLVIQSSTNSWAALIISTAIFMLVGFFIFRYGFKQYKRRLDAVKNGQITTAEVVRHGRAFTFWKSTRNYTVVLKIKDGQEFRLSSPSRSLQLILPKGRTVTVLYHPETGNYYLPQETGVELGFE